MSKIRLITWTVFLTSMVFINAVLIAHAAPHRVWSSESPYLSKVRCPLLAEDSAGHLRLVEYDPQPDGSIRLVYRCMHNGY